MVEWMWDGNRGVVVDEEVAAAGCAAKGVRLRVAVYEGSQKGVGRAEAPLHLLARIDPWFVGVAQNQCTA